MTLSDQKSDTEPHPEHDLNIDNDTSGNRLIWTIWIVIAVISIGLLPLTTRGLDIARAVASFCGYARHVARHINGIYGGYSNIICFNGDIFNCRHSQGHDWHGHACHLHGFADIIYPSIRGHTANRYSDHAG